MPRPPGGSAAYCCGLPGGVYPTAAVSASTDLSAAPRVLGGRTHRRSDPTPWLVSSVTESEDRAFSPAAVCKLAGQVRALSRLGPVLEKRGPGRGRSPYRIPAGDSMNFVWLSSNGDFQRTGLFHKWRARNPHRHSGQGTAPERIFDPRRQSPPARARWARKQTAQGARPLATTSQLPQNTTCLTIESANPTPSARRTTNASCRSRGAALGLN